MLGDAIAPRWNVTAAQLAILEDVYVKEAYPSVEVRGSLANHLGITTRQVQVWFQNRRSKAKKMIGAAAPKKISTWASGH